MLMWLHLTEVNINLLSKRKKMIGSNMGIFWALLRGANLDILVIMIHLMLFTRLLEIG